MQSASYDNLSVSLFVKKLLLLTACDKDMLPQYFCHEVMLWINTLIPL